MAYIPDQAIDQMTKLSAGAWRLYCFLVRCRNQRSGKCCPSINLTMESIGINRGTVYTLRKELQSKSWAVFDGNSVTDLFGFTSPKNQTFSPESEKSDSPKIQTTDARNKELRPNPRAVKSEKSNSPKIQTADADTQEFSESPKNQTFPPESENSDNLSEKSDFLSENSDFLSENSDSHIRKNQQIEPANRTMTADADADAPPTPEQIIWRKGVAILRAGGVPEASARTLLGKLAKDYTKEKLAQAIETVEGANPVSPREYLVKVLKNIGKGGKGNDYAEERNRRARRDLELFRTDWKALWRAGRGGGAAMG